LKKYQTTFKVALLVFLFLLTFTPNKFVTLSAFLLLVVSLSLFIKDSRILKILSFFIFVYLWYLVTDCLLLIPSYILPSPVKVLHIIISQKDVIIPNLISTLKITFFGFTLSILFGVSLAFLMHLIRPIEDFIYPVAVISQSTPTIAIAPLIILWFGFGSLPKIGVVVWATFFPITVNTLVGLKSIDPDMVDVLKAIGAKTSDIFKFVVLPHTLTYILTGIEISSPYAILGTLTAEWMGTDIGMGLYIRRSFSSFELGQVFAGAVIIIGFSLITWGIAVSLRRRFTRYLGGEK